MSHDQLDDPDRLRAGAAFGPSHQVDLTLRAQQRLEAIQRRDAEHRLASGPHRDIPCGDRQACGDRWNLLHRMGSR